MRVWRAAVCDDEIIEADYISLLLNTWAARRETRIKISTFANAEEFLFHYEENPMYDLIFLDIQMKAMNGVELAQKIRGAGERAEIIFITGFPDFMAQGYDVNALHYLMKPVKENKFFEVLDKAAVKLAQRPRTLLLPQKNGAVRVRADEIIYAEVLSHTTTLYLTAGRTQATNLRITDIEQMLGEGFFKCHRSYIVSMAYVRRITRTSLILDDGRELPLSRNLYTEANKAFIAFN